jgi:hypothetical protein
MCGRKVRFVKGAALVAAALLLPSAPAQAGKQSTSQNWSFLGGHTANHVASAPVFRVAAPPVNVSVAVTPPPAAKEVVYVNLRGPDGQVRRFPVEGDREAIQSPQVIVLRPGASVTIRWVVSK